MAENAAENAAELGDPQTEHERRECARHLLMNPLTCAEQHPEVFRLIRRHHHDLDQWFTQRLGYRLHLDADTARLFKSGIVPENRPLRTKTGRPLHRRELQLLALVLASTAAGPVVVSLRDLVGDIRSAATEAGSQLGTDASERRCLVTVLRWMVDQGLATELHEQVDRYVDDAEADAVLRIRPDRIALLPVGALLGESSAPALLARADRRDMFRQWVRCHLVEDSVVYRSDLTEGEWSELRRRQGEEARMLDEMFGLIVESRAEGIAAIDSGGQLSDLRFPSAGTVSHCALLLIERLEPSMNVSEVERLVAELAGEHASHWSKDLTGSPDRLAREVMALLAAHRLVDVDAELLHVRPAARRYAPTVTVLEVEQSALW